YGISEVANAEYRYFTCNHDVPFILDPSRKADPSRKIEFTIAAWPSGRGIKSVSKPSSDILSAIIDDFSKITLCSIVTIGHDGLDADETYQYCHATGHSPEGA
ncbi:MAG: hypothetical protein ABIJ86_00340, partial [Spirochaetota bacterium]